MRVMLANKELKTEPQIERLPFYQEKECKEVKRMFFEAKVQLGFLQVSFSREIEQWQP